MHLACLVDRQAVEGRFHIGDNEDAGGGGVLGQVELVLDRVAKHIKQPKVGVGEAVRCLRRLGHEELVRRLQRALKTRNGVAHPDDLLAVDVVSALMSREDMGSSEHEEDLNTNVRADDALHVGGVVQDAGAKTADLVHCRGNKKGEDETGEGGEQPQLHERAAALHRRLDFLEDLGAQVAGIAKRLEEVDGRRTAGTGAL